MREIWYAAIIVAVGVLSGALLAQTVNVGAGGNGFPAPQPLCPPGCNGKDACFISCKNVVGSSYKRDQFGKQGCTTSPNCRTGQCVMHTYLGHGCVDFDNTSYPTVFHCDSPSSPPPPPPP